MRLTLAIKGVDASKWAKTSPIEVIYSAISVQFGEVSCKALQGGIQPGYFVAVYWVG